MRDCFNSSYKAASDEENNQIDMLNAILSVPAIEFGIMGDQILLIQTVFTDDVDLNGYFILMPDLESYSKMLRALGLSI